MKDVGVKEEDFERLAKASTENMATADNIRKIGYEEYLELYRIAYNL